MALVPVLGGYTAFFSDAGVPVTVYGVATALERSPAQVAAMQEADWEIASHGYKWIEYKDFSVDEERQHLLEAIRIHDRSHGENVHAATTSAGRRSTPSTSRLRRADLTMCPDSYADDLPYWHRYDGGAQLVIPYTLDANDMRFATPQGFNSGDQFYTYLKDTFDTLYQEGRSGAPKMMNIGLHCRLAGRPGTRCRHSPLYRLREKPQ